MGAGRVTKVSDYEPEEVISNLVIRQIRHQPVPRDCAARRNGNLDNMYQSVSVSLLVKIGLIIEFRHGRGMTSQMMKVE